MLWRNYRAVARNMNRQKVKNQRGKGVTMRRLPTKRGAGDGLCLSFPQAERVRTQADSPRRIGNPSENEERFRTSRNDRIPSEYSFANIRMLLLTLFTITVTLCGCMMGPNYQRPDIDTPQSWRFEDKEAKDVANTAWWEQFKDPVLNDLILTALLENKDIKIAAARVEDFMGRYGTTRAALFPQISADATYGRQRVSELSGSVPLENTGANVTFNSSQLFLNAAWEIDLWGKLRRATEAARADLLSTEEARRSVILTLVTSVVSTYIDLRDLDKQLEISMQTAKSREESYNLFKLRFEGGVISELELNQVKSEYEQALSTIPQFEKSIAQTENSLCTLLGRNPGAIARGKTIDQLTLPAIPSGLPSDILTNRPDIRQAEQNLISANANIGVAKALYFPSISLTGLLGLESKDLSDLFKGPAKTWSWAVPASMPIFTAGQIAGQVKAAEALQQQALFTYEKSIQEAFREVDDALIDQKKSREQIEAQGRQVASLRDY
ncbi:MAG TPA: efflux transporter outer membrane subunit, partial [Thermodesulfovibrionales bacterium]|nr:efflux transporter outer membrane subunit [Thermodesulfovibrionales bacterium]